MVLSEIKKYLQTFHMELREDILQDLKEQKQIAVMREISLNLIWFIRMKQLSRIGCREHFLRKQQTGY